MYHFKKSYLALLICTPPSTYAMEYEYINICTLLSLGAIGIKFLSTIYNRHRIETELFNLVTKAVTNHFSAKDVDDIKKYLDKNINPNHKLGPHKQTVLMFAIQHSNKELLKYLLQEKNVKVNISDNHGWTPLHYAINLQNDSAKLAKKYVKKLLKHNSDPNKQTIWVDTPFLSAIRHGYTNLVNLLINYGADINYKYEHGTSLAYALTRQTSLETIEALCQAEATLINIDNNKNSAFHVAINKKCSEEYIQLFITHLPLENELSIQQPVAPLNFKKSHQNQDKEFKNRVMETFLVLRQRKIDPYCQFCILSHVALLSTSCDFNKKFCEYLFNIDQKKSFILQKPFIFHINNQVKNIIKILQIKNDENKTALDLLNTIQDSQYKEKVKPLIDAHKLRNDLNAFNAAAFDNKLVLDDKNVIPQIFGIKLNQLSTNFFKN